MKVCPLSKTLQMAALLSIFIYLLCYVEISCEYLKIQFKFLCCPNYASKTFHKNIIQHYTCYFELQIYMNISE